MRQVYPRGEVGRVQTTGSGAPRGGQQDGEESIAILAQAILAQSFWDCD